MINKRKTFRRGEKICWRQRRSQARLGYSGFSVKLMKPLLVFLLTAAISACATRQPISHPAPQPAAQVDLQRYMGDWFVVANIPYWAERDCYGSIERYLLLPDGQIKTTFLAHKGGFDGKLMEVKSKARVLNPPNNARWQVAFLGGLAKVRMTILSVAPDYRYAVVATPDRSKAWILSRTRTLPTADYEAAAEVLRKNGIAPSLLRPVPQMSHR